MTESQEYSVSFTIPGIRATSPEDAAYQAAAMMPKLLFGSGQVERDAVVTWSPDPHLMFDASKVVTIDFPKQVPKE